MKIWFLFSTLLIWSFSTQAYVSGADSEGTKTNPSTPSVSGEGYQCTLNLDVQNGPISESKTVWSGTLFPYSTIYIDTQEGKSSDCNTPTAACVGHLWLKMSSGITGGLFLHVGRIMDFKDGLYDQTTDITLENITSDIHLIYWREQSFIIDCKKL